MACLSPAVLQYRSVATGSVLFGSTGDFDENLDIEILRFTFTTDEYFRCPSTWHLPSGSPVQRSTEAQWNKRNCCLCWVPSVHKLTASLSTIRPLRRECGRQAGSREFWESPVVWWNLAAKENSNREVGGRLSSWGTYESMTVLYESCQLSRAGGWRRRRRRTKKRRNDKIKNEKKKKRKKNNIVTTGEECQVGRHVTWNQSYSKQHCRLNPNQTCLTFWLIWTNVWKSELIPMQYIMLHRSCNTFLLPYYKIFNIPAVPSFLRNPNSFYCPSASGRTDAGHNGCRLDSGIGNDSFIDCWVYYISPFVKIASFMSEFRVILFCRFSQLFITWLIPCWWGNLWSR